MTDMSDNNTADKNTSPVEDDETPILEDEDDMQGQYKDAEFITPPNLIKAKVGSGGLNKEVLDKAQDVMKSYVKDYPPVAALDLMKLSEAIKEHQDGNLETADARKKIQTAAIDLKSNGAMFNYPIVSRMAHSLLNFVENIRYIDADVVEIIMAHHNSIKAVIDSRQSGDVDDAGEMLIGALTGAVSRYYRREDIEPHIK